MKDSANRSAIINPFSRLMAHEKTKESQVEDLSHKTTSQPDEKKFTKKIRPIEKVSENKISHQSQGEISKASKDEGFQEVKKLKRPDTVKLDLPGRNMSTNFKEDARDKFYYRPKMGKALYDRHSGTGRGTEVAKGGAGGKYTWEGQEVSKDQMGEIVDNFEHDYSNYEDQYYFEALQPQTTQEEPSLQETQKQEITEVIQNEQFPDNHIHGLHSKKEEKRRKQLGLSDEKEKDKDKLERPENSMSYQDYMEQLKKKNENLNLVKNSNINKQPPQQGVSPQELKVNKPNEDIEFQNNLNRESIRKKKEKVKERKVDSEEVELNKLVGKNLSLTNQKPEMTKGSSYNQNYKSHSYGYGEKPTS